MRNIFCGLFLMSICSVQAAEIGVSVGGSLKHFDDTHGKMENGPDQVGLYLRFSQHWQAGVQILHRQGSFSSNIIEQETQISSYGLELKYAPRLAVYHQPGIGVSGGYNRYDRSEPELVGIEKPGTYYAAMLSYDYFLNQHFSMGLAVRHQVDIGDVKIPANSSCNVNCGGLSNIVYSPYAGLNTGGKEHLKDRSLSFNLGYLF